MAKHLLCFQQVIKEIFHEIKSKESKVCVLILVQLFSNDLSVHFYNQSKINPEDDTR